MPARGTPRLAAVLLAAIALLAAACGGDESASVETVPPTSPTTTAAPTTTVATTSTTTTSVPELTGDPAFDSSSSVSTVGIDRIAFGMTLAQVEQALGSEFVRVTPGNDTSCYQIRPAGGPVGVELTITAGTFERVDLTTDIVTTRSGAGVGSTEDELFTLFGDRLTSAPRTGGGNTITFTPVDEGDKQFRVIFETDGTNTISYRSGRVPVVEPLVACSASGA